MQVDESCTVVESVVDIGCTSVVDIDTAVCTLVDLGTDWGRFANEHLS